MTTFKALGLSGEVLKVLEDLEFKNPTNIQEESIPQLLKENRDFIGLAQTGTGKTAAFGLPILERIDTNLKATQALVLAPTRELGQQIAEQLNKFSKYLNKINVLAVYGGTAISNQIKALRNTQHIIIATPGRLLDLINRRAIKLAKIQFLVLDEADEMLNMGFKEDLDKILSFTSEEKLTWLFSATMPKEIKRIVNKYMDNPIEVKVNTNNEVNANIEHQYATIKQSDRAEALTRFLDIAPDMRALVFCRTKRDTQNLAEMLLKRNYRADALHGDLSQHQRDRVMKRFKAHELHVLIATDVAARGIDVNDLSHVFHFNLPDDNSYYTHRSGRTARAGKKGISIAFINGREQHKINRIEKQLGISFSKISVPNNADIADIRIENWGKQILEQKAQGKFDQKLIDKINVLFESLSKEELIEKILTKEFSKLNLNSTKDYNDNQTNSNQRDKGKRRDRNDRRERRDDRKTGRRNADEPKPRNREERRRDVRQDKKQKNKSGNPRFFINVGKRDKINEQDLVDFICSKSKLKKGDFSQIDLQRSFSYFEVKPDAAKNIGNSLNGMEFEDGRELRVNRDN